MGEHKPVTRRTLCFILFALFLGATCWGQNAGSESPRLLAIRADRLVEVGSGKLIANAVVLIEGEKIKAVGSKIDIPNGAQTIDLGNVTILPGLIDCHSHLLQSYYNEVGDGINIVITTTTGTPKRTLLGALNARGMLEAGFTAVRDVGNSGVGGDVALRDAIDAGWVPGPRMKVSTRALAPIGGQFNGYALSPETQSTIIDQEYRVVTGKVEAVRAVRQAIYDGADLIKVIVGLGPELFSLEEMNAIVEEAHKSGRRVAAHAVDDASARIAAEAGVDSVEHAFGVSDEVLKLMASKRIFMVPTDGIVDSYLHRTDLSLEIRQQGEAVVKKYVIASNTDRLQRAMKFGVPIAAGSDYYYVGPPGKTRGQTTKWMLHAYANEGMAPIDVIRAATINAANLLGWQDRVGSIETDKLADLIAVEGDPLKDIGALDKVQFVMKGGEVVLNGRLQTKTP